MFEFKLPDIGEGVVEAEVIAWKVREGEQVAENQVLAEVMTDKATVEIPSPVAGKVENLMFKVGEVAPVGAVLIRIDNGSDRSKTPGRATEAKPVSGPALLEKCKTEPSPVPKPASGEKLTAPPPMRPQGHAQEAVPGTLEAHHYQRAVPAVRKYATEMGIDISRLQGSGPKGRVMRRDVDEMSSRGGKSTAGALYPESYGKHPGIVPSKAKNEPKDWKRVPLRGLRRAIARHMTLSKARAAHYTYVDEIDVSEIQALRERTGQDLSPLAFVARALLEALPEFPLMNASIDEESEEIIVKEKVHLGIATATPDGLVVPVIRNAAALSVTKLSSRIRDLADKARNRKLSPDELRGSTITITSLGKLGGLVATPIINYPETAIVGVHAIHRLPRYIGEELVPRQIMNLSVSLDHRIIDGHECACFVQKIKTILEELKFGEGMIS